MLTMLVLNHRIQPLRICLYVKSPIYAPKQLFNLLKTYGFIRVSFVYKRSGRIISLRSPKHFNIGKLQFRTPKQLIRLEYPLTTQNLLVSKLGDSNTQNNFLQ